MKMTRRIISLLLLLSICIYSFPTYAVEKRTVEEEIPYTSPSGIFASNYNSKINVYDANSAGAVGIPAGYSGYVLKVVPDADGSYAGCELDFSSWKIPVEDIESITFRVILPLGHSEMRLLAETDPTSWVMRKAPAELGSWSDITLKSDGTNFYSGKNMSALANSDGYLGRMCLIGRMGSGSDKGFYLDSVSIIYKNGASDDMTPPVFNYNGPKELNFKEGDTFSLEDISAFDEYDNANAVISYEFSDGALDGAGSLKVGSHSCTVKATDRSGNVSTLEIGLTVVPDTSVKRLEVIPHVPHDTSIAAQDYDGNTRELTADEAMAAGLPAGYNGTVYEISYRSGKSYIGVCLDFSEYNIPISIVESISFNVLMPTSYSELRMRNGNTTDWIMRCSSAPTGSWNTVVMKADGFNFFGSTNIRTLANEEGNLGSFCLIGRNNGTYGHYYIDSIVIKLKDDDKTAPVINYTGKTDVFTSSGKAFRPAVSAFDELEQREVPIDYTWSENAIDAEGNMLEGSHVCTLSATDYFGNTSTVVLNVTVGPPDVEAPKIEFTADEIYVPVGTYYRMAHIAIDNYDDVVVIEEWSEGAIDRVGRLSEGVHTLTLTATDLSGNTTVHVVTVHVLDGDTTVGTLIQSGR